MNVRSSNYLLLKGYISLLVCIEILLLSELFLSNFRAFKPLMGLEGMVLFLFLSFLLGILNTYRTESLHNLVPSKSEPFPNI